MERYYSFEELVILFTSRTGTALEYADENDVIHTVSYSELADKINSAVAEIRASGARVDAIYAEHTPETIVRIFADVIAGCDVVIADPVVSQEALDQVSAIALATHDARRASRNFYDVNDEGSGLIRPDEGELLFFTSGTTERSKIVRLTSYSFCASAWSGQTMLPCGPGDKMLSILPLAHVFGFVCSMLWGLAYGATVALGRDVRHILDDTLFFHPTILPVVPSVIGAMLRFDTLNPEIRVALVAAAPCTPEVTAALRARGMDVYLGYGLTETSSGITITQDLDDPYAQYVCTGTDIRIENDGEISVSTPCMMQGYLGGPQMEPGERFFTGDLGSWDDQGRLLLKGRKKDVLIMADGTKIYCPEYEDELAARTGITDLGIIMKDGHAVLAAAAGSDEEALRAAIAEFNRPVMRSQQIYDVIITDGPLPRTATGKLKRYELQAQFS